MKDDKLYLIHIGELRNVLVHDYLGVDLENVWQIVSRELPSLKRTVARMLGDAG